VSSQFRDQRVPLIHDAMHSFVVTQVKRRSYALYPLLNLIVLLVQKPLLLVIFKKELGKVSHVPGEDCGWVHSLRYPLRLKNKLDARIGEHLADLSNTRERWIIDLSTPRESAAAIDDMYAVGLFYLDLKHKPGKADDPLPSRAGDILDADSTDISFLIPGDMRLVVDLFASLRAYESTSNEDGFSHLRHVAHYWCVTREKAGSLFDRPHDDASRIVKAIEVDDLERILKPVLDEIDAIYQELRGGTPGDFSDASVTGGASILWSRNRDSLKRRTGIRPPTLALYMQLRVPFIEAGGGYQPEKGYRIVPIVTEAICKDLAAVLIDYVKNGGSTEAALAYLTEMGMANARPELFASSDRLASAMSSAMSIRSFLGRQYFHSMTYPAFSSGISMFVEARAHSRADLVSYGPTFLKERDCDTAFIKPTLISGFPFVTFMTKTRARIGHGDAQDFDTFYYNHTFQMGILRRWMSKRIRTATESAFVEEIVRLTRTALTRHWFLSLHKGTYRLNFAEEWVADLNGELDRLAQALPYARVQVTRAVANARSEQPCGNFKGTGQCFEVLTKPVYFWFGRNDYYHRKLIDDDLAFVRPQRIQAAFRKGYEGVLELLNQVVQGGRPRPH
jgi:hypothetical protein